VEGNSVVDNRVADNRAGEGKLLAGGSQVGEGMGFPGSTELAVGILVAEGKEPVAFQH